VDGEKRTVKAERAFAQSGGMSTTKSNLVADYLPLRLNSKGLFMIGFAIDLCMLIKGRLSIFDPKLSFKQHLEDRVKKAP
jgi:hypothetical protein